MAQDNKLLGTFVLDGIAPAPRGIPQIEVTFDIDANGIVHVSAQDKGTGKEQHITVTASSNMSKEEIDKAVKEAEQFAEQDKKQKEKAELHNSAEQASYMAEKTLKDMGDKLTADEKSGIETAKKALDEVKGTDNLDDIKKKMEELQQAVFKGTERIYKEMAAQAQAQQAQQGGQQPGNNAGGQTGNNGGTYEADFKKD